MPRVTEIIDYLTEPELVAWLLRTPKAKREASSQDSLAIGTMVDILIQKDLFPNVPVKEGLGGFEKYDIPITNCMRAWEKFKADRPDIIAGVKEIQTELKFDGVVGHPDIVWEDEKRWGIIDVKTSRSMYPKYWTQTSQYSELKRLMQYPDQYRDKPRFIAILRLDKETGTPHYLEITDEDYIQYEISVFNAYRLAYEHNMRNREQIRGQLELEVLK